MQNTCSNFIKDQPETDREEHHNLCDFSRQTLFFFLDIWQSQSKVIIKQTVKIKSLSWLFEKRGSNQHGDRMSPLVPDWAYPRRSTSQCSEHGHGPVVQPIPLHKWNVLSMRGQSLTSCCAWCGAETHPTPEGGKNSGRQICHTCRWQCEAGIRRPSPALHSHGDQKKVNRQRGSPRNFHELLQAMLPCFSSSVWFSKCVSSSPRGPFALLHHQSWMHEEWEMGKQQFRHLGCWEEDAVTAAMAKGEAFGPPAVSPRHNTAAAQGRKEQAQSAGVALYMGVKHSLVIHWTNCTSPSPPSCFLTASVTTNVTYSTRVH